MTDKRILIVDDDPSIAQACVKTIQTSGYEVKSAGSGEEAIEILKKEEFHLIITDLQMPGISGMELLQYIKNHHQECDVIIITAYPSADTAIEALRAGVYDYIKKPLSITELREKVKKCLDAQSQHEKVEKEQQEEILTTYQASKYCGVTLTTVTNWIDHGMLNAYKTPGGHRRIKKQDLIEFIKKYNMPLPDELK